MNKFLIDECIGRKLYQSLLEKDYDVKFVTDFMKGSTDDEVLTLAEKENRVLITNDKDFGELIFRLKMPSSGVILLRLKNNSAVNKINYTSYVIENFKDKLSSNFIVVSEKQVRVRSLK